MANHLLINWQGAAGGTKKGHRFRSYLDGITGVAQINAFVDAIRARTDVKARTSTLCYVTNHELVHSLVPGTNCNRVGKVYFRDPDSLAVHSFSYPDPQASDSELTDDGERLTSTAVSEIVAAINTATGKSYTPLWGVIEELR